jgi:hypothetical protein
MFIKHAFFWSTNHTDIRLHASILKLPVSRKPAARNLGQSRHGARHACQSLTQGMFCRVAVVFLPALFIIFYQAGTSTVSLKSLETIDDAVSKPTMTFGPLPLKPEEKIVQVPHGQDQMALTAKDQNYKDLPATSTTSPTQPFQLPRYERAITLVHVGKSGGLTMRRATSLTCRLSPKRLNTTQKMESCLQHFSIDKSVLAHDVKYYLHMYAYKPAEIHNSTSFLFLLRNPVDRVISSFRYSHPQNCESLLVYNATIQPWSCRTIEYAKKRRYATHQLYTVCFPSAAMEEFAQNVLSPFPQGDTSHHFVRTNIARQFIQGHWEDSPAPHMKYNYEHYRNITISSYPNKEVLGVRTKNQWEDIKALDIAMGGRGIFSREGHQETHGSENYIPSPLTTSAYHKLCCVLEHEIGIFADILNRVINLNATVKQEMMDDVRHKCGLGTQSWDMWRRQCQERLAADILELEPFLMANNSKRRNLMVELHGS